MDTVATSRNLAESMRIYFERLRRRESELVFDDRRHWTFRRETVDVLENESIVSVQLFRLLQRTVTFVRLQTFPFLSKGSSIVGCSILFTVLIIAFVIE